MNSAGLIPLALLIWGIYKAMFWVNSTIPTAEDEEAQGKRDMEELIKRANEEHNNRPRVRAGTYY